MSIDLCDIDCFLDFVTRRRKSLSKKYYYANVEIKELSLLSNEPEHVLLEVRSGRSSKSLNSELHFFKDRWCVIKFFRMLNDRPHLLELAGRCAVEISCETLVREFEISLSKMNVMTAWKVNTIKEFWESRLLSGPKGR